MTISVTPSVKETAFSCPHCNAYTTQYWYRLFADSFTAKTPKPFIPNQADKIRISKSSEIPPEHRDKFNKWIDEMLTGLVHFEHHDSGIRLEIEAHNLHLTKCYNCKRIAVWLHDRMIFPATKIGVNPNPDLPPDIVKDYEEAREIADASPRGSAALLRLCIQKLCKHLGEKGKNIDEDIGCLVKKGLNPLVQQSLDVVRVIGNEAVHPGVIDLNDERETALTLFQLLNTIADQMITHPKMVKQMYDKLPEDKRKAIESRDRK